MLFSCKTSIDSIIDEYNSNFTIDYAQLELTDVTDNSTAEYQNSEETNALVSSNSSFDEILTRVKMVILNGITAYETRPDQMEEEYRDLAERLLDAFEQQIALLQEREELEDTEHAYQSERAQHDHEASTM